MPTFAVDVHPSVYEELEYSRSWYEERAENLGTEFLDEVSRAVESVRERPTAWPFRGRRRGIRRYLVHRFPYGIVYRLKGPAIQIVAVMHLRRHPDYWKERLQYWNGGAGSRTS
ncbi:type II toxin-antitoxin system RelE/ParE family toxin [Candidatus Sumerlaeota bacterium]|nr:type II toxin-antitoxin system RelE/ParE family toxin [Candidatus Sumerlaeota bacterium]